MNKSSTIFHEHPSRLAAAGVLLCLLAACKPAQPAADAQPAATPAAATGRVPQASPSTQQSDAGDNPDLGGAIKLAASYSEMKSSLAAHDWSPVNDPNCLDRIVGRDAGAKCTAHPDWEECGYCKRLDGLSQCSADGYCKFVFERKTDGRRLDISMKGDIGEWEVNAPDTMFGVDGWRYESPTP